MHVQIKKNKKYAYTTLRAGKVYVYFKKKYHSNFTKINNKSVYKKKKNNKKVENTTIPPPL